MMQLRSAFNGYSRTVMGLLQVYGDITSCPKLHVSPNLRSSLCSPLHLGVFAFALPNIEREIRNMRFDDIQREQKKFLSVKEESSSDGTI